MYHVVETVDVYVCKFGICGTKFQRKPLKKKQKNKPQYDKTLCRLCVLYMRTENLGKFCIYYYILVMLKKVLYLFYVRVVQS